MQWSLLYLAFFTECYLWDPSMLSAAIGHSFSSLYHIPLCAYTSIYSFSSLWTFGWFPVWGYYVWIKFLWTFINMSFGGYEHPVHLEVDLFYHGDLVGLVLMSTVKQFSKAFVPIYTLTNGVWNSICSLSLLILGIFTLFNCSHSGGFVRNLYILRDSPL